MRFHFSPLGSGRFTALINDEPIADIQISGESTIETRRPLTRAELAALSAFVDLKEGRQRLG